MDPWLKKLCQRYFLSTPWRTNFDNGHNKTNFSPKLWTCVQRNSLLKTQTIKPQLSFFCCGCRCIGQVWWSFVHVLRAKLLCHDSVIKHCFVQSVLGTWQSINEDDRIFPPMDQSPHKSSIYNYLNSNLPLATFSKQSRVCRMREKPSSLSRSLGEKIYTHKNMAHYYDLLSVLRWNMKF